MASRGTNWLDTYKACDYDTLANNIKCKVFRISKVKFKMFDEIVKALSNVRNMLELRRNLILLWYMDSLGYGYPTIWGIMKVINGVLVVI